jgi:hypothetical protein
MKNFKVTPNRLNSRKAGEAQKAVNWYVNGLDGYYVARK